MLREISGRGTIGSDALLVFVAENKVEGYFRNHRYGCAILRDWLELPLPNCFLRSLRENCIRFEDIDVLYVASFRYQHQCYYLPLYLLIARLQRVDRVRYFDGFQRVGFRFR